MYPSSSGPWWSQVAHHPWRDRNWSWSGTSRDPRGRSSPLEGSQRDALPPGGLQGLGRSSPLEGSQLEDPAADVHPPASLITPGGIATQMAVVRGQRVMSLITPGGIATRSPLAFLRVRSGVAHHPWRDRNITTPTATARRRSVAHHPWRDRNSKNFTHAVTRPEVAHHPWRDRNIGMRVIPISDGQSRSSPLEGSQLAPAAPVHHLPLVAHHPWRDRNTWSCRYRSASEPVAHHPWRDRNGHRRGLAIDPPIAHHPWRDCDRGSLA